jgi:ferredoxin
VLKGDKFEFEDEQIGIIFPTYMFSAPEIIYEFLDKVSLKTNYFFGIATYGNTSARVVDHFIKMARKHGLEPQYANSILMVDNSLNIFDMSKEVANLNKKSTEQNIKKIVDEVNNKKKHLYISNFVMKNLSDFTYNIQLKLQKSKYKQFKVEDNCIKCETCKKICPKGNVTIREKAVIGTNCIGCYACTQNCPVNAIRVKGKKVRLDIEIKVLQ